MLVFPEAIGLIMCVDGQKVADVTDPDTSGVLVGHGPPDSPDTVFSEFARVRRGRYERQTRAMSTRTPMENSPAPGERRRGRQPWVISSGPQ